MNKQERENVAANAVANSLNALYGAALTPTKWDDGSADRITTSIWNRATHASRLK